MWAKEDVLALLLVPGLGSKSLGALRLAFYSVEELAGASAEHLAQVVRSRKGSVAATIASELAQYRQKAVELVNQRGDCQQWLRHRWSFLLWLTHMICLLFGHTQGKGLFAVLHLNLFTQRFRLLPKPMRGCMNY